MHRAERVAADVTRHCMRHRIALPGGRRARSNIQSAVKRYTGSLLRSLRYGTLLAPSYLRLVLTSGHTYSLSYLVLVILLRDGFELFEAGPLRDVLDSVAHVGVVKLVKEGCVQVVLDSWLVGRLDLLGDDRLPGGDQLEEGLTLDVGRARLAHPQPVSGGELEQTSDASPRRLSHLLRPFDVALHDSLVKPHGFLGLERR
mmetsp:Transcript_64353/g.143783  ORF Transcript_64353/g.143783 Transcript_64353/m.143783 type:complete len:201 (+) Transcript_64353:504-1106(+)